MTFLASFTLVVNFAALVGALWLGLYLVTRSPRYLISWLTALTLWSLAGLFLNVLLALNPPPVDAFRPSWLRFLFPFWTAFEGSEPNAWLQGWSVAPAIAFWHHATMLLRPGKMNAWRWIRIIIVYLVAATAVELQAQTQILVSVKGGDPLYLNSLQAGPLYPFFGIALIGFTSMCLINLVRSARSAPSQISRNQLRTLAIVTAISGLVGPLSIAASVLALPIPMVVLSITLGVTVGLIGYGIASYSALMEGRTLHRDFRYNLILVFLVTTIYFATATILVLAYRAPAVIVIVIPILAVITHMLMNSVRRLTDLLFYKSETTNLRSELHHLIRLAGEGEPLQESLTHSLEMLCRSIRAVYGLLLICENEEFARMAAEYRWEGGPLSLTHDSLSADDVTHIAFGKFPHPLEEVVLLIPIYDNEEQIGALLFGHPINGVRYADEDVENLMNAIDWIGDAISHSRHRMKVLHEVAHVVNNQPGDIARPPSTFPIEIVENALRNIYDYAYLADSELATLKLVRLRLDQETITHLDRGKIVYEILIDALDKLSPNSEYSAQHPPREWYPYLILRDAYLEGVPNRDIMINLYISEGTFNRTRRAAIRSLARALFEMEMAVI